MSDIIGNPTTERELEDQWHAFLSEPVEHQLKLDDESLRVYGKTNKERYEEIKSKFLKRDIPYPTTAEVDNMVHEEVEYDVNYNLIDYPVDNIEDAKHWGLINNKAIVYPTKIEEELDKQWYEFNSMIRKSQRESDWKSLELFGMDNKTHYEYLKSKYLKQDIPSPQVDQIEEPIQIASVEESVFDIPKNNVFPMKSPKLYQVQNGHRESLTMTSAPFVLVDLLAFIKKASFPVLTTAGVVPTIFSQYYAIDILNTDLSIGDEVVSVNDGKVIATSDYLRESDSKLWQTLSLFGNFIVVEHTPLFYTLYAHLNIVLADVGDKVLRGEVIGKMGNTGNSTAPHLHFQACVINPTFATKMGLFSQSIPFAGGLTSRPITFDNIYIKRIPASIYKDCKTMDDVLKRTSNTIPTLKWQNGKNVEISDHKYIHIVTTNKPIHETSLDDMGYTMDDSIEYFKDHISDLSTVPQEALPYYDIEEIEYLKGDDSFRYNEKIKDPDVTSRAVALGEFEKAYKEFCETGKRFDTKSWEKEVYKLSSKLETANQIGLDKEYIAYLEECLIRFGWNPSIPFNEQTRMIGSIRYANKRTVELIDLTESADFIHEAKKVSSHLEPVYIVLVQGKSIFSKAIMMKTKGPFSHAAIGLDPSLETLYSYNIDTFGLAVESVKRYSPEIFMNVFCVFVKPDDKKKIERVLKDFTKNRDRTSYSFANIFAFAAGVPLEKQYSKMCSQFVDTVLKLSDIDITKKNSSLVAPNDFMYAAINDKRIYKLYEGTCGNFNEGELKYKTKKLKKNAVAIKEAKDLPVYFDDSGNLLIKNMKKLDLEAEYASCHKLLLSYEKTKNVEGMKYELSKLWFMNQLIERKLHNKNIKDEERDALNKVRARILNDFYKYLEFVQKIEPDFNFNKYYEESPFSDAVYKVTPSTLKFTIQSVKNLIF